MYLSHPQQDKGPLVREWTEYTNDNGAVIEAHVVTDETAGSVNLVGRGSQHVGPGEVLVKSANSNMYDVMSKSDLDGWNSSTKDSQPLKAVDFPRYPSEGAEDEGEFDPSENDATTVRNYLSRPNISDAEYARVVDAERAGKNRRSAIPA